MSGRGCGRRASKERAVIPVEMLFSSERRTFGSRAGGATSCRIAQVWALRKECAPRGCAGPDDLALSLVARLVHSPSQKCRFTAAPHLRRLARVLAK